MRVLVVNDRLGVSGGADRASIDQAMGLRGLGHDVTFLAGFGEDSFGLRDKGIRVVICGNSDLLQSPNPVAAALKGLHNSQSARVTKEILSGWERQHAIVYIHSFTKAHSASVAFAASRAKVPIVVDLHDYFVACPTGTFYDHGRKEICRRVPLGLSCLTAPCDSRSSLFKAYRVVRQIAQHLQGMPWRIDAFVTHSRLAQRILQPYLPSKKPVLVLTNPINLENQGRIPAENNRAFLMMGRMTSEKGMALAAAATLQAGVPLIICGEGPDLANVRNANPNADFRGWQNRHGMDTAMRSARALIFPSLWYEVQGMAAREAMARGLPVVTTSINAASEEVENGCTGLIVDPPDLPSFTASLLTFNDDAFVESMSQEAYKRFWSNPPNTSLVAPILAGFLERVIQLRMLHT